MLDRKEEVEEYQAIFDKIYKNSENDNEDNKNKDIQKGIEKTLFDTRELYWGIIEAKQKGIKIKNDYQSMLNIAIKYAELASTEMDRTDNNERQIDSKVLLKADKPHIIYKPKDWAAVKLRSFFGGLPLLTIEEIKYNWLTLIEAPSIKIFFVLIGSILTLLFGEPSVLTWPLFILVIAHTITRFMANKYKGTDNYVTFNKNIQLFLWPYFWLAVGTALSHIISVNGFPEGTFIAALTIWLIWGELKGIVENAEICDLPVPPLLKKLVKKKDDNDLTPL